MNVKIDKGNLVITLPLSTPTALRAGLPQSVAGSARVMRTKVQVAGNDLYVVANAFICPGKDTVSPRRTDTADVITSKMLAARKALEERKAYQRRRAADRRRS